MNTKTISGEVVENPYGNWSDVDRGWYIGSDKVQTLLYEYEGKNVKITIEVLPENDSPKNAIELIEEVEYLELKLEDLEEEKISIKNRIDELKK